MTRKRPAPEHLSPYITPGGYAALEQEVRGLWARRGEVVRHLAAAAAEGDRSENAEYIYRKKELRALDRRLGYLQRRLPRLRVVAGTPADTGRVFFGARLRLEDEEGVESEVRIVGTDEIDPARGLISVDSPLARALLGRRLDEEVSVRTERGETRYVLTAIAYGEPTP